MAQPKDTRNNVVQKVVPKPEKQYEPIVPEDKKGVMNLYYRIDQEELEKKGMAHKSELCNE